MTGPVYTFSPVCESDAAAGVVDLSTDPAMALFAQSIAGQQRAGMGTVLDCRQIPCPTCKAPGFNDGWGGTVHTCGAEIVGGEFEKPCQNEPAYETAETVEAKIRKILAAHFTAHDASVDTFAAAIDPAWNIVKRFDADSLDLVELQMAVEDTFHIQIPDELLTVELTVGELVALTARIVGEPKLGAAQ